MDEATEIHPIKAHWPAPIGRVALVWRGDPRAELPPPLLTRLGAMVSALGEVGLTAEPVVYADDAVDEVRAKLLTFDGVLVWVDPLSGGQDRSRLDPLLREIAGRGIWVSAHPDTILKMGAKDVLYRTRDLGWGADTDLYASLDDFRRRFPARLGASGPRVLKQYRGNGGQGVWKVELLAPAGSNPGLAAPIRVLHALRGSALEDTTLGAFMDRCEAYFVGEGRIIDQAFQPRLPEGMVRVYFAGNKVVGFGHQLIKALVPPPPQGPDSEEAQPGPRIMYPAEVAMFRDLRRKSENEWVPQMQALLDISTASLPALWDADFLLGPKTRDGRDTHLLCEINVSAVSPYPDSAPPKVAQAALRGVLARKDGR
jgi:hypothetical protein